MSPASDRKMWALFESLLRGKEENLQHRVLFVILISITSII